MRLNKHRLWAHVKETDLSLITSMKGASAGYRTALAPFMPVIRLRSLARPAALCDFFFMIPQPVPI